MIYKQVIIYLFYMQIYITLWVCCIACVYFNVIIKLYHLIGFNETNNTFSLYCRILYPSFTSCAYMIEWYVCWNWKINLHISAYVPAMYSSPGLPCPLSDWYIDSNIINGLYIIGKYFSGPLAMSLSLYILYIFI